jgi:hypothetical protein
MPFLEKRLVRQQSDATGVLGANNTNLWKGDEYTPSSNTTKQVLNFDGLGLPASMADAQKRLCGNEECAGGWTAPWRNRRRPIFEGQWGCSGRCVLAIVRATIQREIGGGTVAASAAPHRHRVPLGLIILAQGWITHPQLRQALDAQRENGSGRIGDWLISECGLEREQITRALSMQWNCPVLSTKGFSPEAMALVMPRLFVEEFKLLPLRVAGAHILYLGSEDRLDASVVFAMEQMTGLKVESGLVDEAQFQSAKSRQLSCDAVPVKLEAMTDRDMMAAQITAILEQKQPIASRLVRVHHYYWLRLWLEKGATGRRSGLPMSGEDVCDHVFNFGAHP